MSQLNNKEIINILMISVINVIRRRTSEEYAFVIIDKVIKNLREKHYSFNYIEINKTRFSELEDIIDIKEDINYININDFADAINEFFNIIASLIGGEAGYYFIKEVEEELPSKYQSKIKELDIDLGIIQFKYFSDDTDKHFVRIENSELLYEVLKSILNILSSEIGKNLSVKSLKDLIERLSLNYEFLKYIKIHDTGFMQGEVTLSVLTDIDYIKSEELSNGIQDLIQDLEVFLKSKCGASLTKRLRHNLNPKYISKLKKIGINLEKTNIQQDIIVKHVLNALINLLSEISTKSYAVLVIDKVLRKIDEEYGYLKFVKIDNMKYSEGIEAVKILSDINSANPSDLGRGIQKLIEKIAISFGEETGRHFIDKFKDNLNKTCLRRIEEMGVNLHMIQLRQNLLG
jgi:hypothetical protein